MMVQCDIKIFEKFFTCVVDILIATRELSYVFPKIK